MKTWTGKIFITLGIICLLYSVLLFIGASGSYQRNVDMYNDLGVEVPSESNSLSGMYTLLYVVPIFGVVCSVITIISGKKLLNSVDSKNFWLYAGIFALLCEYTFVVHPTLVVPLIKIYG